MRLELRDARTPGLILRVTATGVKSWYVRYRTSDGRQPRILIGKLPAVTLKDARTRAVEILFNVSHGADPATQIRQARAVPDHGLRTFNDLADLYEQVCAAGEWKPKGKRKRASVLAEEKRVLSKNVRPVLGRLPYDTITRQEVKALLRAMHARGIDASTNRTHGVIRQVFNFAISEDIVTVNPATGFLRFGEEKPRQRTWKDEELRILWEGLSDPTSLTAPGGGPANVGEAMCIAIKLAVILGQRRAEISGMELDELNLEARTWLIRPERMKGGRPHMVPLPNAAVLLIRKAIALAAIGRDRQPAFVFPTNRNEDRAIRPCSLSLALARTRLALGLGDATLHDLRRTVSTNLTSERCGVTQFIRSKILGHIDAGGGAMVSTTHYDVNTYLREKRRGLEGWTAVLMQIVGETDGTDGRSSIRLDRAVLRPTADNDNGRDTQPTPRRFLEKIEG